MSTVNRYTPEEDKRILEAYWDPKRRRQVTEEMADRHTARSIQFRYFQLLKLLNLGGSPTYRRMMEQYEQGKLQLPFTIDELVEKVHSGQAREEERQRRAQKKKAQAKAKAAKEPAPKPESKPEPASVSVVGEDSTPLYSSDQPVSIVYSEDFDRVMAVLESLDKRLAALESKLESKEESSTLVDFFSLIAKAAEYREKLQHIDRLMEENRRLRTQLNELQEKYDAKVAEFDDIYGELRRKPRSKFRG